MWSRNSTSWRPPSPWVDCPRQRVNLTNTHFNPLLAYLRGRKWQPTPVILPGESHGQRSLAVYSPWGCKESDTTRWLNHHHQLTFLRCKAWLAKNVTFQAPLLLLSRHVWDLGVRYCMAVSSKNAFGLPWWFGGRLCTPNAGGPGLTPGQGTRSHMPKPNHKEILK